MLRISRCALRTVDHQLFERTNVLVVHRQHADMRRKSLVFRGSRVKRYFGKLRQLDAVFLRCADQLVLGRQHLCDAKQNCVIIEVGIGDGAE